MNVGFVGLGNMGGPMARNLLAAGHELKLFDLVESAVQAVGGGSVAASAAEAASDVDVFISMLPAGRHARDLYLGDGGILDQVAADTLLIDCSTIDPICLVTFGTCEAGLGGSCIPGFPADAPNPGCIPLATCITTRHGRGSSVI